MATLQTLKSTRDAIDAKTERLAVQVANTKIKLDSLELCMFLEKIINVFEVRKTAAPSNEQIDEMLEKYRRLCE